MTINEQWKELESVHDEYFSTMLDMQIIKKLPSKNPLVILKKNVLINSIWAILTGIMYVIVVIVFPFWQVIVCFGIVILFTCWGIMQGLTLYKTISVSFAGQNILGEMERHYNNIKRWMSIQGTAWIFIYPVTILGGCMVGGIIGSGKPVNEVIQNPVVGIASLVALVILVPFCIKLGKQMNRKAFGQYIMQLEKDIQALKADLK